MILSETTTKTIQSVLEDEATLHLRLRKWFPVSRYESTADCAAVACTHTALLTAPLKAVR